MTQETLKEIETDEAIENKEVEEVQEPDEVEETEQEAEKPAPEAGEEKTENEEQDKPEPSEAEKIKSAMQKRIDRLTYQIKTQEEEFAKLKAQAQQPEAKAPSEDDFDSFEEYQEALVEFKADQKLKQIEQERKQKEAFEKQKQLYEAGRERFEAREAEFTKQNPDYPKNAQAFQALAEEVIRVKGQTPSVQAIGQVLTEAENAPALINHLAQNEDLVYELADKTPVQVAFEMFKLQESLEAPKQEKKPLPEPVKPVKATGKANKSLKEMSGEELLQKFAK